MGNFALFFFQLYPTHSRSVYDPTEMILAILYSKVPHMLHANYQPNWHSGSGEEVVLNGSFKLVSGLSIE